MPQVRNFISSVIHQNASKAANPLDEVEIIRNTICMELSISRKQLTRWETNSSQPTVEQLLNIRHLMASKYSAILLDELATLE